MIRKSPDEYRFIQHFCQKLNSLDTSLWLPSRTGFGGWRGGKQLAFLSAEAQFAKLRRHFPVLKGLLGNKSQERHFENAYIFRKIMFPSWLKLHWTNISLAQTSCDPVSDLKSSSLHRTFRKAPEMGVFVACLVTTCFVDPRFKHVSDHSRSQTLTKVETVTRLERTLGFLKLSSRPPIPTVNLLIQMDQKRDSDSWQASTTFIQIWIWRTVRPNLSARNCSPTDLHSCKSGLWIFEPVALCHFQLSTRPCQN